MGRPKTPPERRVASFTVRLDPPVADAVCKFAVEHDISVYRLLGNIITKSFSKRINSTVVIAAYVQRERRSSSASGVAVQFVKGVSSAQLASTAPVVAGL